MTKRELEKHFKKEDIVFSNNCMKNSCNGCPNYFLCFPEKKENKKIDIKEYIKKK